MPSPFFEACGARGGENKKPAYIAYGTHSELYREMVDMQHDGFIRDEDIEA